MQNRPVGLMLALAGAGIAAMAAGTIEPATRQESHGHRALPRSKAHRRPLKGHGGRPAFGRYKGSPQAKRATRRGGNHAKAGGWA